MNEDRFRRAELNRLISEYCDGQLSSDSQARLKDLLASSREACDRFVLALNVTALVERFSGETGSGSGVSAVTTISPAVRTGFFGRLTGAAGLFSNPSIAATLLLAASLYGTFGLMVWQMSKYTYESPTGLAVVSDDSTHQGESRVGRLMWVDQCIWQAGENAPRPGEVLSAGKLSIVAGAAEIRLENGVRIRLQGPCQFDARSTDNGYLAAGKLLVEVPAGAVGYAIETPTARVVDLGTEFGVEVFEHGVTDVHVLRGCVETTQLAAGGALPSGNKAIRIEAGSAIRVPHNDAPAAATEYAGSRFGKLIDTEKAAAPIEPFPGEIPLGNLFDDPAGATIREAVATDTFRASAEIDDVGVDRVLYGGDSIKQVARNLSIDLSAIGWQPGSWGNVSNDTWTDFDHPTAEVGKGGIRTQGKKMSDVEPRIEEGIGSHANALITFDLDEIRNAAGWKDRPLRFVCDRAGINDDTPAGSAASVNLAVLVADTETFVSVHVNGSPAAVARNQSHWYLAIPETAPIHAGGGFVSVDVAIPVTARYLTLIASSAGNGTGADHAVWSGARLEQTGK